jgi:hypothetical protein
MTSSSRTRVQAKKKKKTELAQIDRELDRYMERWARHAIILDDDGARRLTEEEVRMAAWQSRPGRRLSSRLKAGKKRQRLHREAVRTDKTYLRDR